MNFVDLELAFIAGSTLCKELQHASDQLRRQRTDFDSLADRLVVTNSSVGSKLVVINIGGSLVTFTQALLCQFKERSSLFTLISGKYDHLLPKDKQGRIFLDLNPAFVELNLNHLRDLEMAGDAICKKELNCSGHPVQKQEFCGFLQYFQHSSSDQHTVADTALLHQSKILFEHIPHFDHGIMAKWLKTVNSDNLSVTSGVKLLFRGSRDGFKAKAFHEKCDGQANTICIVRDTDGNVFGGFADVAWSSIDGYQFSKKAFLFSLLKNGNDDVVQQRIKPGDEKYAMYHYRNSLFIFGSGHDLILLNDCNLDSKNSWCSPSTYNHLGDKAVRCFKVAEVEVFQLTAGTINSAVGNSGNGCSPAVKNINKRKRDDSHLAQEIRTPCDPSVESNIAAVESVLASLSALHNNAYAHYDVLVADKQALLLTARRFLDELRFIAMFTKTPPLPLPCCCAVTETTQTEESFGSTTTTAAANTDDAENVEGILSAAQSLVDCLLSTEARDAATQSHASSRIVYINAGGKLVATTVDTLRQAPEGSPLANMASDAWGHDLDSDGNIYQDVNSELFVAIINHLRLKQLLGGTSIQVPPIVVYEEQKTALDNLLSFYMLTDLPVETIRVQIV